MKLMLGTPAYRGIQCGPFLDSLEATVKSLRSRGVECDLRMIHGNPYVQTARNQIASQFLASDCAKLLFLDDDISWDPRDVLRLLEADRLVVAGIYPMKADGVPYPCVLQCNEAGYPLTEGEYLLATRVATGFLMIDRSVFEQIRSAYPHLEYVEDMRTDQEETKGVEQFDFFPQGVRDRRWVGEDYAFCMLWTGLGGKIHIIPDMTFGHHGTKDGKPHTWTGNLLQYLKRQPGGSEYAQGEEDPDSRRAA